MHIAMNGRDARCTFHCGSSSNYQVVLRESTHFFLVCATGLAELRRELTKKRFWFVHMRNSDAQHRCFGDGEVCAPHIKSDLRNVDGNQLMYTSNRNRVLTGVLLHLMLLWSAAPSLAFVYRPDRFEKSSGNGKFVASVLAARGQVKRPTLEL